MRTIYGRIEGWRLWPAKSGGKVGRNSLAEKLGGKVERHCYGRIEGWRLWPAKSGGKVGRQSWAAKSSVPVLRGSRTSGFGRVESRAGRWHCSVGRADQRTSSFGGSRSRCCIGQIEGAGCKQLRYLPTLDSAGGEVERCGEVGGFRHHLLALILLNKYQCKNIIRLIVNSKKYASK
jgi:hypothetical protein